MASNIRRIFDVSIKYTSNEDLLARQMGEQFMIHMDGLKHQIVSHFMDSNTIQSMKEIIQFPFIRETNQYRFIMSIQKSDIQSLLRHQQKFEKVGYQINGQIPFANVLMEYLSELQESTDTDSTIERFAITNQNFWVQSENNTWIEFYGETELSIESQKTQSE